jgi:hypothetical protein
MEQLAIQRERVAMIAEVEPEDREPGVVEQATDGHDIVRLRAALPPVQQDGEASRLGVRRAEMAEQANSGAAIDDLVAGGGQHACRAAPEPPLPPWPTGQQRLDMPVLEAARRVKGGNGVRQTRPRNKLAGT